ncbi:nitroreductase family protein [Burkholderiaceae bacterium FT117]|uniref:nitroreductase family protein n=1 Tax=Zeimonas sediminis TaxID=2944268 RepID=UPI002342E7EE|nr:nitroreductase family protein [Zeimonas sediminis]MCM5571553.1 nitroreductase family protein [Zeimonas sediminis]
MQEPGLAPDPEDVLGHLLSRHSIGPKHLVAPGPGAAQLRLAARAALRAPDHRQLAPARFIVVPDARRDELAALFEDFARRSGKSPAELREESGRAYNGPVLVALAARIDPGLPEVPPHEQWIAVGGALANFMNALHLMGFGAKMLSGRKASDPAIAAALCEPGETLVGWIAIGTPAAAAKPRGDDEPERVLRDWDRRG